MIKYILNIFEGAHEELWLNDEMICCINRTPVNLIKENLQKIQIINFDKSIYTCEYDMDITIQPGQRHSVLDLSGTEIATSVINSDYTEELNIENISYHINKDHFKKEILFYEGNKIVASIKGYCFYRSNTAYIDNADKCEIWIDETARNNHMKILPSIIAAYPSFGISY